MSDVPRVVSVLTLLTVLAAGAGAPAQRTAGADAVHGFSITPPRGWSRLPAEDRRGQLVGLWCGPRALAPKTTSGAPHTPALRVFVFDAAAPEGDVVDGLRRRTPFRDLDDYLQRQYGGRARITEREAMEIGDVAGRRFVAEVSREDGDRRLFGVTVSRGEQRSLVVEFEVLADHADKHARDALRSLASLELDAPEGDAPARAPWLEDADGWRPLDPEQRRAALADWAEATVAHTTATAEAAGWKEHRNPHWTVLSNASTRDVRRAVDAADRIRAWAEEHFAAFAGDDTLPAVLRIYDSPDQLRAVQERQVDPRDYAPSSRTLHFAIDRDAGTGFGYGPLFRAVVWHWIDDHVPGAMRAAPRWLELGLWEYLRSSRVKGRNIEFTPSDVERGRIEYQLRNESMPAVWNLIQESIQPEPENGAVEDSWGYTPECARLMRWLLEGDGKQVFAKEHLLCEYFTAIGTSLQEVGRNPTADVAWSLLEPDAATEARERFYEWRAFIRDNANFLVIPLEPEDWQAVNAEWLAYVAESD